MEKLQYMEARPLQPSYPLNLSALQLASRLVQFLSFENPNGLSISCLSSFLDFILARIGNNKALDSVVECLRVTYSQMLTQNLDSCENDAKKYSKALRDLKYSLCDKEKLRRWKFFCSIMLLFWYEVR